MDDMPKTAGYDSLDTIEPSFSDGSRVDAGEKVSAWRSFWIIVPILLIAAGASLLGFLYWGDLTAANGAKLALLFQSVLVLFVSLLAPLICIVQNATKQRQRKRLNDLARFPIAKTLSYRTALATIDAIEAASLGEAYLLPMIVYFMTILIGSGGLMLGFNDPDLFDIPNFLLSGLHTGDDLRAYQRGTFVVIGFAFFASYSYSLGMLLNRINNNDLYPISLHYYAVRVVMASIAAAVLRHSFTLFQVTAGDNMLIVAAFAIGFAPDLFMLTILRTGFQALKIWAVRSDPGTGYRPDMMPLLMIDDLSRDKVDRLTELGIDSVQILARQNPFLLLPRLPFELSLLIDWIAQAQLYVFARDAGMAALRKLMVCDIFDARLRLDDPAQASTIAHALGLADDAVPALRHKIDADPTFLRLRQVRSAMCEGADVQ